MFEVVGKNTLSQVVPVEIKTEPVLAKQKSPVLKSVAELRSLIQEKLPADYIRKMFHKVPELPVVKERKTFLAALAKGATVLDIGCTGQLSKYIRSVSAVYYGVDCQEGDWTVVDLDKNPEGLPAIPEVTLVICSEVIEHLSNPGRFLDVLRARYPKVPVCITVPHAGAYMTKDGCEVVNNDHVAWYSYTTLKTLITRAGFEIVESAWYNGKPHKAEGLIMIVKGLNSEPDA